MDYIHSNEFKNFLEGAKGYKLKYIGDYLSMWEKDFGDGMISTLFIDVNGNGVISHPNGKVNRFDNLSEKECKKFVAMSVVTISGDLG